MDSSSDREFMKFSDQIRLQTASLSLGDTIWTTTEDHRRNLAAAATATAAAASVLDLNSNTNNPWKPDLIPTAATSWKAPVFSTQKLAFGNSSNFDRYNNCNNNSNSIKDGFFGSSKAGGYFNNNNSSSNYNGEVKNYFNKAIGKPIGGGGDGRKKNSNFGEGKGSGGKKKNGNSNSNDNGGGAADKRFKTLPPSEALPRTEPVGGYIFVCNNDTMQENLKRELFGLPPRYRDSVRAITPGLPLFLYNYSTHQLHGIFEAASFGGTNIDPTAWEDKKCPGESRFPAQVRVMTRKICGSLEEDSFRPILHHYDGPKFRLELSIPEALALLDIFAENNA